MAKFTIEIPNKRGTGGAATFEIVPATDNGAGHVAITVFKQAGFFSACSWSDPLSVRLGFRDLSKLLQVFRGMTESINNGSGLLIDGVIVKFQHTVDSLDGYWLSLSIDGEPGRSVFFGPDDAFALMLGLERAMVAITFGAPSI